jgi:hypothetical protein
MIHCLQGNLAAAALDLGRLGDARLDTALDWLARSITGAGIAPAEEKDAPIRYYRSGNSAPGFACAANNQLPCAWGAVKAMLGVEQGSRRGAHAGDRRRHRRWDRLPAESRPSGGRLPDGPTPPSQARVGFRFGYPIAYVTDVLQNLEVLVALGCGGDVRLRPALELLLSKQDRQGAVEAGVHL